MEKKNSTDTVTNLVEVDLNLTFKIIFLPILISVLSCNEDFSLDFFLIMIRAQNFSRITLPSFSRCRPILGIIA